MTESIVEINGHLYRYDYVGGKTVYKGPVGNGPELSEQEFLLIVKAQFKGQDFGVVRYGDWAWKYPVGWIEEAKNRRLPRIVQISNHLIGLVPESYLVVDEYGNNVGILQKWIDEGKPLEEAWDERRAGRSELREDIRARGVEPQDLTPWNLRVDDTGRVWAIDPGYYVVTDESLILDPPKTLTVEEVESLIDDELPEVER